MTGSWRQFFLAVFLIAVPLSISLAEEPSGEIDPSLVIEQFDVFGDGDLLIVPVTVFGKSRMFVVDTGSTAMAYDQRLLPNLGEPIRTVTTRGLHEKHTVKLFHAPSARLGGFDLQTEAPVASLDMADLREASGHEIEGLIGMIFLHQFIVHIDFEAGRLSFLTRVPEDAGERIHIFSKGGSRPLVMAQLSGADMELFAIDTGYLGKSCLRSNLFERLAKEGQVAATCEFFALDLFGGRTVQGGSLKGLSLSKWKLSEVPVSTVAKHAGNLLGCDILRRFTITLDFPNKTAYLKPNRFFVRPFAEDIDGMTLIRRDGHTVVQDLEKKDAPAAKAGIQRGDRLLEIDGTDATATRLFTLRQTLNVPGATVHVKLERGDELVEVDLELPGAKAEKAEEATEPAAVRTANASEGGQQ